MPRERDPNKPKPQGLPPEQWQKEYGKTVQEAARKAREKAAQPKAKPH